MDNADWLLPTGSAIAILVAVGASFRSLRNQMRAQDDRIADLAQPAHFSGQNRYGLYMVGMFDLLGQSAKLAELLPQEHGDHPRDPKHTMPVLKSTAVAVAQYRHLFRSFFEITPESSGFLESVPPSLHEEVRHATDSRTSYWSTSDAFFVAVPVQPLVYPIQAYHPAAFVIGAFRFFITAASMWLIELSKGRPVRGGIEVGVGIQMDQGDVYGSSLSEAYRLESTVAEWPRVVVGNECVKLLKSLSHADGTANDHWIAGVAKYCLAMLAESADGTHHVDALSGVTLEHFREGGVEDYRAYFLQAHKCALEELKRSEERGDSKLASRYRILIDYFDAHRSNWLTQPPG